MGLLAENLELDTNFSSSELTVNIRELSAAYYSYFINTNGSVSS